MNKMTTNVALTIKDGVQHDFAHILREVKTDKYILISEKTDPSDNLLHYLDNESSFSCEFYSELKDVLTYVIEKIRKSVYDGHKNSIDEWFRVSKNFFEYFINPQDSLANVYVCVYNIKSDDEKIIRTTLEKINVKEIS